MPHSSQVAFLSTATSFEQLEWRLHLLNMVAVVHLKSEEAKAKLAAAGLVRP